MRESLPRFHGLLCALMPTLALPSPSVGATVQGVAREALAASLAEQCEHYRIRLLRRPAPGASAWHAGMALRAWPSGTERSRQRSVRVDALDGSAWRHRMTVTFAVGCWRTAYRTLRDIPRGEALGQANTGPWRVSVTGGRASHRPLPAIDGLAARRSLPAGLLLGAADTMPLPLVGRHERVRLQAVSGSVVVDVPGWALADAGLGETVLVRPLRGTRAVRARVTGAGRLDAGQ